jgi:hypothetical protein
LSGIVLAIVGVFLIAAFETLPLELPPIAKLMPIGMISAGLVSTARLLLRGARPPNSPIVIVAGLLLAYIVVTLVGFPAFERAKPIKEIARWVASAAAPTDRVASFRLNRWTSSWRFYVDRPAETLETTDELRAFLSRPGVAYCAMLERDMPRTANAGIPLKIVYRREGLFATTGPALRAGRRKGWATFVVTTNSLGR